MIIIYTKGADSPSLETITSLHFAVVMIMTLIMESFIYSSSYI